MKFFDLKIPSGQQTSQWVTRSQIFSQAIDADLYCFSRIVCPDVLSTITSLTIETEHGGTKTLKSQDGITETIMVSAAADVSLRPAAFPFVPNKFRIKSNVAASADRIFSIGFRKV